jgi:hypothetical protein
MGTVGRALGTGLLLSLLPLGCHSSAAGPAEPAIPTRLRVLPVEPDVLRRPGMVVLEWRGALDGFDQSFALLDESGYRGMVRTVSRSKAECDHCGGPLLDARLVSGTGPSALGAVAVGPVAGPLGHAKLERVTSHAPPDEAWRPSLSIDLDGDGSWDFQEMQRCGHYARSGCSGSACDMICTVVARVGQAPDPGEMDCRSFAPDLEDCDAGQ